MKNQRLHGVSSLIFTGIAILIAATAIFKTSIWLGIGYLFVCILALGGGVSYTFCAKCPCKTCCGHVFPGKVAMLFKQRSGPYTITELIISIVSLLLVVILPQPILLSNPGMLVVFWVLIGVAGIQARSMVCRACGNVYCPLKKAR